MLHGPFIDFCFKEYKAHECVWDTARNQSKFLELNYNRMYTFIASGMSFTRALENTFV